jgi:chemotaxis family two-component system sensor kinase Cph1
VAARIGGDEFAVVCRCDGVGQLQELATDVVAALTEPVELEGSTTVRIGASAGVAVAEAGAGADALLEAADAALYQAKRSGGGIVRVGGSRDRASRD